jgi:putative flippase GtrA
MKAPKTLFRQGIGYGLVGAIVLLVDWMTFVAFSALGLGTVLANISGRLTGAYLGFWLNGRHTFRDANGTKLGWTRFSRYLVTWCILSTISSLALLLVDRHLGLGAAWLAKPAIDAALAAVAFMVSRHWVFS